jgi:hypothetical protein
MNLIRLALLPALLAQTAAAQLIPSRQPSLWDKWVLSASVFGGLPVGEFKEHEDGGGGLELMLGFQPWRRQPLVLRGNLIGMQYGGLRQRGFQDVCDAGGSCWTEEVTFDARNHSMYFWQFGPEFMATDGTWRPFGFALLGTTVFSSRANLAAACPTCNQPPSQRLFSSSNLSTAYGLGLRRVGTLHGREHGFELSARVMRNAEAEYLTEDGVQHNADGSWTITPRRGAANVLGIHVGYWMGPHVLWNERRAR